ncbi:hypothetical protein AAFF_G00167220 [Aldrovandia affinis]|uniref:Uncharacterized protein n=1 Tax=Aldrovandia affinis TaxID=143900 RepID=A0AAD7W814_9TELE|nr:hypothetical protein AAFF_G00167220 [Aldrovandia affinis]
MRSIVQGAIKKQPGRVRVRSWKQTEGADWLNHCLGHTDPGPHWDTEPGRAVFHCAGSRLRCVRPIAPQVRSRTDGGPGGGCSHSATGRPVPRRAGSPRPPISDRVTAEKYGFAGTSCSAGM